MSDTVLITYKDDDRTKQYDSCLKFLHDTVAETRNGILCDTVLRNKKFLRYPASCQYHHAYKGGLVVHTSEVLDLSLSMVKTGSLDVDVDIIVTAVLWHDYGKIFDYEEDVEPVSTMEFNPLVGSPSKEYPWYSNNWHHDHIRHLARSYHEFLVHYSNVFGDFSFGSKYYDFVNKVSHCILSHHGERKLGYGSAVSPKLTEAHIIHQADMLSSRQCSDYYVKSE